MFERGRERQREREGDKEIESGGRDGEGGKESERTPGVAALIQLTEWLIN